MALPHIPSTGKDGREQPPAVAVLVDDMVACYANWREAAAGVRDTHRRWREANNEHRDGFAAYMAALDQEQSAAARYAQIVTDLERWLRRPTAQPR